MGDLNGGRESRPMSQFVSGGPADLEQRTDVSDADQPVGVGVTGQQGPPFRYTGGRHDYDGMRGGTGNQYQGEILHGEINMMNSQPSGW
jgi:hypothetical protein